MNTCKCTCACRHTPTHTHIYAPPHIHPHYSTHTTQRSSTKLQSTDTDATSDNTHRHNTLQHSYQWLTQTASNGRLFSAELVLFIFTSVILLGKNNNNHVIIPCLAKRHSSLSNTHYSLPGQEAFKSTKHTLFLAWPRGIQVYQTHIPCLAKRHSSQPNTHYSLHGQEAFKSTKHTLFLAWPRGVQVNQAHIIPCLVKRCSSLSNTRHHHLYGQEVFKSIKHMSPSFAWPGGVQVCQTLMPNEAGSLMNSQLQYPKQPQGSHSACFMVNTSQTDINYQNNITYAWLWEFVS